jgi:hypothetical protein
MKRMSGRLISADAVKEKWNEAWSGVLIPDTMKQEIINKFIDDIPTAYDPDMVCAEILISGDVKSLIPTELAIKLVKDGGV